MQQKYLVLKYGISPYGFFFSFISYNFYIKRTAAKVFKNLAKVFKNWAKYRLENNCIR